MRIGVYGGTFAPVHNGHIQAAKAFMEQMWLDVLYIVPDRLPPHKEEPCGATAHQRLKMCDLAFAGMEGVVVTDMELQREDKSYTVDTLRELAGEDRKLFLLCGTDMLLTLDRWREPEEIFRLCYPVYVRRENDKMLDDMIVAKIREYREKFGKMVRKIVVDPIDLSSSEIREDIRAGRDISEKVPPAVCEYIRENHLFAE